MKDRDDCQRVVFLVGPAIALVEAVGSAFEKEGWSAQRFVFRSGFLRLFSRLTARLFKGAAVSPREAYNEILRAEVIPAIDVSAPDLVVVVQGYELDEDNHVRLRDVGCPVALWAIDSLTRLPDQASIRNLATHSFFMDGGDVTVPNSSWLPMGWDETALDSETITKEYDVVFVGYLKPPFYNTRRRFLERLAASDIPNRYRCLFVGTTGTRVGNSRLRRLLPFGMTGRVPMDQYAEFIARARVCINIHQDDGLEPVNPTFFLVPGAGTCQLSDTRPYLSRWLEPARDYIEVTEENFVGVLDQCLESKELAREISEHGRRTVTQDHTYRVRVGQLLNDIYGAEA